MPDRSPPPPTPPAAADRFEVLRASRELFQRRLTEIVKQCGVSEPAVLAAFGQEVGEAHDQLAAASGVRDDSNQAVDLTASRLTLMGDDELELDISISGIGSRLREAGGRNLWRSQLRYMTLLSRPTMSAASNPVGAEAICPGLWVISRQGVRIEQTLALLDRLEQGLTAQLPALYGELDSLLAGYGIQPTPGQYAPLTTRSGKGLQQTGDNRPAPANALLALQQEISQRAEADQIASPLPFSGSGAGRSGNPPLYAAAMVMLRQIVDRLTTLEARSAATSVHGAAAGSASAAPPGALKTKDLGLPLGKREAIILDTMAMIFEVIFDSPELPDAIKAAIGRLQIPLLKLSIIDPSLFANDQHPARLLINRIARAALGLPHNAGSEHPLCKRIGRLIMAIRDTLEQNDATLDAHLAELEALISERDQAIQLATATHVELVLDHENRQLAAQLSRNWLHRSLAKTSSPVIATFLDKYWSRVMTAAAADGGQQGQRWQQDSTTGDYLIWSVLPKQTAEDRKRLASLASSLLGRIGAGLDAIGVSAEERSSFLNTLFDLQTRALRSQAQAAPAPSATDQRPPEWDAGPPGGPCLLERDGQQVRYLRTPAGARSLPSAAADWQVGDWLRFSVSDQSPMCGLCCWQNPSLGTVLLFNPDWGYAVAIPRAALEQQIHSGRAQVASHIAIFDVAAERALSLLDHR